VTIVDPEIKNVPRTKNRNTDPKARKSITLDGSTAPIPGIAEYLPFFTEPMKSNKTGVHGVSETFYSTRNGRKIPYFSVFWAPIPNQRRNKRFYHHHFDSREEALQTAADFRKEKEAEILARYQAGEYK